MAATIFKCRECETEYFVLESHKARDTEAKCVDCGSPFVAKGNGIFLRCVPTSYVFD
jgi:DNA-directed RNA polymerase subunit RPC12/RpoP